MSARAPRSTAFGAPGIAPTQAAGDKDAVVRSLGSGRLWATVGGGVVNEVFWPTPSRPQLRDLGFLVSGPDFWVDVKRLGALTVTTPDPAVPVPTIVHRHERFMLETRVVCASDLDALTVEWRVTPTRDADAGRLTVHALAAPHLGGSGHHNSAWADGPMLLASGAGCTLALVCDPPPVAVSVGYVGASDGWQDLHAHGSSTYRFTDAPDGNVALTATLAGTSGRLALGFADQVDEAQVQAVTALENDADAEVATVRERWLAWADGLPVPGLGADIDALARRSAMVAKLHEAAHEPGAIVASLATPWGFAHDDPGGYHLVWPRDCVESALALAAVGRTDDAVDTLRYLVARQQPDGHWHQNFTVEGEPYWTGRQLDETALPVLLAVRLAELGAVEVRDAAIRDMVRRASSYLAARGPMTEQDRWEESAGASPFTLAVTVAALAGAALAGWLDRRDARYSLSLADWWNARIEGEVYVSGSPVDARHGTAGHYERIAAPGALGRRGSLVIANRGGETEARDSVVGLEFLALVRHGLRAARDLRITDTVAIVDTELRVASPSGPLYHRYQDDGYGEHDDGSPFDGTGVGRPWPLLAGERGAYAVRAGEDPMPYLRAMAASVSSGGLLPEQVWDGPALPERRLVPWRPTGSATPLVWAHAEFVKLALAASGRPHVDTSPSVAGRYAGGSEATVAHVRGADLEVGPFDGGWPDLLFDDALPFRLHVGVDGWNAVRDLDSEPLGLGRHGVRIGAGELTGAAQVDWTRYDPASMQWEGRDHTVRLAP